MANQEAHYGFDEGGDDDQSIVSVCRYSRSIVSYGPQIANLNPSWVDARTRGFQSKGYNYSYSFDRSQCRSHGSPLSNRHGRGPQADEAADGPAQHVCDGEDNPNRSHALQTFDARDSASRLDIPSR